jgi:hypothetical protein
MNAHAVAVMETVGMRFVMMIGVVWEKTGRVQSGCAANPVAVKHVEADRQMRRKKEGLLGTYTRSTKGVQKTVENGEGKGGAQGVVRERMKGHGS